jgi:hypothetical protein
MADESTADDGAVHRFWAFIVAQRAAGVVFDLDDLRQFHNAVDAFDHEQDA